MFTAAFTICKMCKPKCSSTDECIQKMWCVCARIHIHTQRNIIRTKKEENPAICYNTDESWGHYVKWSKSEKVKHCLIIQYVKPKKGKLIEAESITVAARGRGGSRGNEWRWSKDIKFHLQDKFWRCHPNISIKRLQLLDKIKK